MALPKLNVPVYEAVLPSTEKVIKFRPFLVKEEKVLLTAMEDGGQTAMMNAIKNILKNCVQQKLEVDKLPLFDIEYLFLKLRSKSIGEKSEIGLKCSCDENAVTQVEIDMDKIEVEKPEGHTRKVMINDEVGVMLSYPVMKTAGVDKQDGMLIVRDCIEMIFTGEETHEKGSFSNKELDEFIESMSTQNFEEVGVFFETMPKLIHIVKTKNPKTKKKVEIPIEGLQSFFA